VRRERIDFEMGNAFEIGGREVIEALGHIKVEIGLIALLNILFSQMLQVRNLLKSLSVFIQIREDSQELDNIIVFL
jgi:hypothetical protein